MNTAIGMFPKVEETVSLNSSIRDALPESIHNRLIQLRDEQDRLQWLVGDLFNEIYTYVRANKVEATRADVATFLLQEIGLEGQRSYSSVLIDAATAAFYLPPAREHYVILPFSHFRFAAGFGEQAGKVLETAMIFVQQYGRAPSLRWLKQQFSADLFELAAKASDPSQALAPEAQAAKTANFGEGPDFPYEPKGGPIEQTRFHVVALRSMVTRLPGNRGELIARIVALCDQALEEL